MNWEKDIFWWPPSLFLSLRHLFCWNDYSTLTQLIASLLISDTIMQAQAPCVNSHLQKMRAGGLTLFKTIHNLTNVIPTHWAQTIAQPSYFIALWHKEGCVVFLSRLSPLSPSFFSVRGFSSLDSPRIWKKRTEGKRSHSKLNKKRESEWERGGVMETKHG